MFHNVGLLLCFLPPVKNFDGVRKKKRRKIKTRKTVPLLPALCVNDWIVLETVACRLVSSPPGLGGTCRHSFISLQHLSSVACNSLSASVLKTTAPHRACLAFRSFLEKMILFWRYMNKIELK